MLALAGSGCGSSSPVTAPTLFKRAPDDVMWRLPTEAYPSQRLYRIQYQGPEGNVGLRMTLYLGAPDHYRMDAADSLGRKVWSLAVEPGDRATWLDHRKKLYCRVYAASEQSFVPIAQLPLVSLPSLILGRLPVEPRGEVQQGGGKISFRDSRGHLWNAQQGDSGRLEWWSLLEDGEPVAWWRHHGEESVFSDRRGGQQVRWTEQVRETLDTPLRPVEVPDRYREGACIAAPQAP